MVFTVNKVINGFLDKQTASFQFELNIKNVVRSLKVKQIVYADDVNLTELESFAILYSDLVQNETLGMVNMTSTSNATATAGTSHQMCLTNDLQYIFNNPIQVSGTYNFFLKDLTGDIYPFNLIVSASNHLMGIVIEFECV